MQEAAGQAVTDEVVVVFGLGVVLEESGAKVRGPVLYPTKVLAEATATATCNNQSRSPSSPLLIGEREVANLGRARRMDVKG